MTEIPDWIEDKLEFREGRSLQQSPVVQIFLGSERPYLTRRQVQTRLKGNHARGTVIDRLSELCEVGVLKHEDLSGGGIYWINNSKSDWPIPPDVEVEPESEEMTASEFFNLDSVRTAVTGLGGILLSSILIWGGGSMGVVDFSILGIRPSHIIAGGLLVTLLGWILFGYGVFKYFQQSRGR
jgi:hypothetical protein